MNECSTRYPKRNLPFPHMMMQCSASTTITPGHSHSLNYSPSLNMSQTSAEKKVKCFMKKVKRSNRTPMNHNSWRRDAMKRLVKTCIVASVAKTMWKWNLLIQVYEVHVCKCHFRIWEQEWAKKELSIDNVVWLLHDALKSISIHLAKTTQWHEKN